MRLPISTDIPLLFAIKSPYQWVDFLKRHPEQRAPHPATITLNRDTWMALVYTNSDVNRMRFKADVGDRWDIKEQGDGDCDDYSITKRYLLGEQGLPLGALRPAWVQVYQGDKGTEFPEDNWQAHLVLTAWTDRGVFVLDNVNRRVRPWTEHPYNWSKVEWPVATHGEDIRPVWRAVAPL